MSDKFNEFRNIKATPEELRQACNFIQRKRKANETRLKRKLSKVKRVDGYLFSKYTYRYDVDTYRAIKLYFVKHKGFLAYNYPIGGITTTVFIDKSGKIHHIHDSVYLTNIDSLNPDAEMLFLETSECTSENITKLLNLWKPNVIDDLKKSIAYSEDTIKYARNKIVKDKSNINSINRRKVFKLFKPKKLKGDK